LTICSAFELHTLRTASAFVYHHWLKEWIITDPMHKANGRVAWHGPHCFWDNRFHSVHKAAGQQWYNVQANASSFAERTNAFTILLQDWSPHMDALVLFSWQRFWLCVRMLFHVDNRRISLNQTTQRLQHFVGMAQEFLSAASVDSGSPVRKSFAVGLICIEDDLAYL
jgi:hypothetical protein